MIKSFKQKTCYGQAVDVQSCTFREYEMIREANESDCINLAALSLEVWLSTYSIDGIRTENSQYALSTFTEKYFKKLLCNPKYKLLVKSF